MPSDVMWWNKVRGPTLFAYACTAVMGASLGAIVAMLGEGAGMQGTGWLGAGLVFFWTFLAFKAGRMTERDIQAYDARATVLAETGHAK